VRGNSADRTRKAGGSDQQLLTESHGVFRPDPQRGLKYPRLVFSLWVQRVQAIIAKLGHINKGAVTIWMFHGIYPISPSAPRSTASVSRTSERELDSQMMPATSMTVETVKNAAFQVP
jgi:hypothetical protein